VASVLSSPPCPLPGGRGRQGEGRDYWQLSIVYFVFHSLLRSSVPGMYLMALQIERALPVVDTRELLRPAHGIHLTMK